jgi:hypothetical protein
MPELPVQFEDHAIRRVYDEPTETWWFSVVDIIKVLTQQPDSKIAGNYWRVLKSRLRKEGSETITRCNGLKMTAEDGKQRLTDVATAETLLRLVQSIRLDTSCIKAVAVAASRSPTLNAGTSFVSASTAHHVQTLPTSVGSPMRTLRSFLPTNPQISSTSKRLQERLRILASIRDVQPFPTRQRRQLTWHMA